MDVIAMREPATANWNLPITTADFQKLKTPFEPQDQDDKWRTIVTPHTYSISIHIVRCGTGREIYVLHVNPGDQVEQREQDSNSDSNNRSSSSKGVRIEAITWEQNKGGIFLTEEQAKKEVVMITRCDDY